MDTRLAPTALAPHSPEAEESTIGAVLIDPAAFGRLQFLQPADFYLYRHNCIWAAFQALHERAEPIDQLTVVEELRRTQQLQEIGGSAYLVRLSGETPTSANAETFARIVQAAATRRRWLTFSGEMAQLAVEENATIDTLQTKIDEGYRHVMSQFRGQGIVNGNEVMHRLWDNFWEWVDNPAAVRGMSSGIPKLDRYLMGFRPGLYAIAGASSMGKSTFAGALVRQFAQQARGVFVPTEIEADRAFAKIAGDWAGIPYKKLLSGMLDEPEKRAFQDAFGKLAECAPNVTVFDTAAASPAAIQAEVIRTGAKWVIVDSGTAIAYQQQGKRKDLYSATSDIAQAFQNIGRWGVAVIVLWQIGRSTKDRDQKWPTIHDFKQSGAIEETADVCLGLYRHDYYVKRQMAKPDPQFPPGTGTVFILKDRDGGDGDDKVTLKFVAGKGFYEVDPALDGKDGR